MIKVQVPATTANLGPGFDCLGLALKLYLKLEIEEIEEGFVIEYQGEGAEKFSAKKKEDTLIWKSINLVLKRARKDIHKKRLKIRVFNEIPITRGLGSSASAIIGGIVGAAKLYNINLTNQEMLELYKRDEKSFTPKSSFTRGGIQFKQVCSFGQCLAKFRLGCVGRGHGRQTASALQGTLYSGD